MWLNGIRFYTAVIALLAFTGQSFAVVNVPCSTMNHPAMAAMMAADMDMDMAYASHAQAMASDAKSATDCCGHKQCAQSNCISASVAVIGAHSPFLVQFSHTLTAEYAAAILIADSSSPFRPPISR